MPTKPGSGKEMKQEVVSPLFALSVSLCRLSSASSAPHSLSDSLSMPGLKQEILIGGDIITHVCAEHYWLVVIFVSTRPARMNE